MYELVQKSHKKCTNWYKHHTLYEFIVHNLYQSCNIVNPLFSYNNRRKEEGEGWRVGKWGGGRSISTKNKKSVQNNVQNKLNWFRLWNFDQVWRLDLGSPSPHRTHDVKIGYIPNLMVILSVKASQVLVVPKNVGFSIPRYEPEPEP